MGSFRGGLGVGWVVPEGVEDDIVGDAGWRDGVMFGDGAGAWRRGKFPFYSAFPILNADRSSFKLRGSQRKRLEPPTGARSTWNESGDARMAAC